MFRLLAAVLVAGFSATAFAQAWPSRPIRIIVPYSAGGSSDFTARTVADRLGPLLGTSVIVDARPGGNTVIGTEFVVKSPADGYTLLLAGITTYGAQPHLMKSMPYDVLKDLTPTVRLASTVTRCLWLSTLTALQANFCRTVPSG